MNKTIIESIITIVTVNCNYLLKAIILKEEHQNNKVRDDYG